jgi:hypothetical protein
MLICYREIDMADWIVWWALCGLVSCIVAASRGASGFVGFMLGVLLGPFGIIIAFVLKPEMPSPSPQAEAEAAPVDAKATYIRCNECSDFSPSHSKFCMHCGQAI